MYQYQSFKAMIACWGVALVIALSINACAGFKPAVKRLGDATYEAVLTARNTADNMVANGSMSKIQRQEFAKNITVPTLTILEQAIIDTLAWKEGEPIPENVSRLIGQLTKSADDILKTFGKDSNLHSNMLKAKSAAQEFLDKVQ